MQPCTFALYCNRDRVEDRILDRISEALTDSDFVFDEEDPYLHIVFGGDGAFLYAIQEGGFEGVYILVNCGHLGFFADYDSDHIEELINDILNSDIRLEAIPLLEVSASGETFYAASDISLQSNRTSLFSLYVNNLSFTDSMASGIVVGNKLGSTGYLASLGSPAIISSNDIYEYAFNAPVRNRMHNSTVERGILSSKDRLEIEIEDDEGLLFYVDGQRRELQSKTLGISLIPQSNCYIAHFDEKENFVRIKRQMNPEEEN